eukprot:SAG25_NODE_3187_length_1180_cov_1.859389_2_plen_138_part_00
MWRKPTTSELHDCMSQDHKATSVNVFPVPKKHGHACLYDLRADPGEHKDISQANKGVVRMLTSQLNLMVLTQRDCSGWTYATSNSTYDLPGPLQPDGTRSCSPPDLLGHCNVSCANSRWASYGKAEGPICGVPNCEE